MNTAIVDIQIESGGRAEQVTNSVCFPLGWRADGLETPSSFPAILTDALTDATTSVETIDKQLLTVPTLSLLHEDQGRKTPVTPPSLLSSAVFTTEVLSEVVATGDDDPMGQPLPSFGAIPPVATASDQRGISIGTATRFERNIAPTMAETVDRHNDYNSDRQDLVSETNLLRASNLNTVPGFIHPVGVEEEQPSTKAHLRPSPAAVPRPGRVSASPLAAAGMRGGDETTPSVVPVSFEVAVTGSLTAVPIEKEHTGQGNRVISPEEIRLSSPISGERTGNSTMETELPLQAEAFVVNAISDTTGDLKRGRSGDYAPLNGRHSWGQNASMVKENTASALKGMPTGGPQEGLETSKGPISQTDNVFILTAQISEHPTPVMEQGAMISDKGGDPRAAANRNNFRNGFASTVVGVVEAKEATFSAAVPGEEVSQAHTGMNVMDAPVGKIGVSAEKDTSSPVQNVHTSSGGSDKRAPESFETTSRSETPASPHDGTKTAKAPGGSVTWNPPLKDGGDKGERGEAWRTANVKDAATPARTISQEPLFNPVRETTSPANMMESSADPHPVIAQIIDGVAGNGKSGGRFRISLQPESLGRLTMDILVRRHRIDVIMRVENQQVQQIIASRMDDLKAGLQSQGLQTVHIDVSLQGQNHNHNGGLMEFSTRGGGSNREERGKAWNDRQQSTPLSIRPTFFEGETTLIRDRHRKLSIFV